MIKGLVGFFNEFIAYAAVFRIAGYTKTYGKTVSLSHQAGFFHRASKPSARASASEGPVSGSIITIPRLRICSNICRSDILKQNISDF